MAFFRCGGGGLPAGLQTDMDAVLNKKFSTSTTYPPTDWPDTVNLMGPLPEKTASGSVAHVTDGADAVPIKNWLVTLPASLDGYDFIVCAVAKTNLFDGELEAGWIGNDGSESPTAGRTRSKNYLPAKASTPYYVTCSDSWRVYWYDGTQTFISYSGTYSSNRAITSPNNACYFRFAIVGETPTGVGLNYPSTETSAQTPTAPTQYTVSLGRTIYGGTADIVTGEGEDENGNAFTFTPITPTPETPLGVSNWWADEGDSDVTYRADISLALQANNGNRGLMMMRPQEPEETEETEGLDDELNR